jgi:predicted helicase
MGMSRVWYPEAGVTVEINNAVYDNYEVTKRHFPDKDDKSHIIYNPCITITNMPAEACEYVVNGKSAIEWIMERYQITTHKESSILNDPNSLYFRKNRIILYACMAFQGIKKPLK